MAFACSIISLFTAGLFAAVPDASITIHADRDGAAISPTLYGIFFEEINRAGDGGIYGEMLENRSFEDDASSPVSWSGFGRVRLSLDRSQSLNPRNPTALRIDLTGDGGGVVNVGFCGAGKGNAAVPWETIPQPLAAGLAIRKGLAYRLSLYTRGGNGFGGTLTARLEGRTGKPLAEAAIHGIGVEWKKYDLQLTATEGDDAAHLVLEGKGGGSVWLDMVSLFPKETWKNHGLRKDLAEMVAAMKPGFVRFPGGCFVEGDKLVNAVRWKETIGPVEERKGNKCLWGYQTTAGFGTYEFFQWCEDLNAEPLYVINCGMSHEEQEKKAPSAGANLQDYVQDALDIIEYARGPVDSKWGSLRAKAGHPAPFKLNYMEIGNENSGATYQEHYALFHDALKAKYPDITLVANGPTQKRTADIVDEHHYSAPRYFRDHADMFDKSNRKDPKIYVGEYAVTKQCGLGNVAAALGEAAYMTGLERNSDHVVMASYAPLFVNPTWRRWNPNAIVFDQNRCYGTPSYHVQALFANHVGSVVCPSEIQISETLGDLPAGGISLGTYSTQAEYKDIHVEKKGSILFDSNQTPGLTPWRKAVGVWKETDNVLSQTGDKEGSMIIATGDASWGSDYTLKLKAKKTGGKGGFLIGFQLQHDREKHWLNLGGFKNTQHFLEGMGDAKRIAGHIENDRWYDICIELKGDSVACFLDGQEILRQTQMPIRPLFAVASRTKDGSELILKVVNTGPKPITTAIDIEGVKNLKPAGQGWVISAVSDSDENSFERPKNIAPVEISVPNVAPRFERAFPARSVTVLRLGMTKP